MIDPKRLADELAADRDVLRSLASNGDKCELVRPIDLHFKGRKSSIEALANDAVDLGLHSQGVGQYEDGQWFIDMKIDGTTELQSIELLTKKALAIELSHFVEYDGWGCIAQIGPNH